ncbi:MAG TPA: hypothetical protein PLY57_07680 [Deltaproteobacteria bacterium]|nr:hypothetical protein [Deltaproteobacteria bacterium]
MRGEIFPIGSGFFSREAMPRLFPFLSGILAVERVPAEQFEHGREHEEED